MTVTVAGHPQHQRNTTRFPDEWRSLRPPVPTLTISVEENVATIGGTGDPGQLAGLLIARVAAVHRTLPGDTPATVATALGAAFNTAHIALTAQAAQIVAPVGTAIVARVQADQPSLRETRRQEMPFRVICWCPDPNSRDLVAAAIDSALSAFDFLGLPDGMAGRLRYVGTSSSDRAQDAALYRRDLIYTVDYATTLAADLSRLLFGDVRVSGNGTLVKTLLS